MAVLVTMRVGPVDFGKFKSAVEWWLQEGGKPAGMRSSRVYQMESDPKTVLVIEEWDSHDAFHASSEEAGEEFNRRAGTEGLDWETGVWVLSEALQV